MRPAKPHSTTGISYAMLGQMEGFSARNRFPGRVVSVESDGVMALVKIESGEHQITAAITREAAEELGLVEGAPATATVKATSVMVQRGS
jgi:molybdopterin-binding protein